MNAMTMSIPGSRLQELFSMGLTYLKQQIGRAEVRVRQAEAKLKVATEYAESGYHNSPQRNLFEEQLSLGELVHQSQTLEWAWKQIDSSATYTVSLADIDAISHGAFGARAVRDVQ